MGGETRGAQGREPVPPGRVSWASAWTVMGHLLLLQFLDCVLTFSRSRSLMSPLLVAAFSRCFSVRGAGRHWPVVGSKALGEEPQIPLPLEPVSFPGGQ